MKNPGIVRNKLKVNGFVRNARAYLDLLDSEITFTDTCGIMSMANRAECVEITRADPGRNAIV